MRWRLYLLLDYDGCRERSSIENYVYGWLNGFLFCAILCPNSWLISVAFVYSLTSFSLIPLICHTMCLHLYVSVTNLLGVHDFVWCGAISLLVLPPFVVSSLKYQRHRIRFSTTRVYQKSFDSTLFILDVLPVLMDALTQEEEDNAIALNTVI